MFSSSRTHVHQEVSYEFCESPVVIIGFNITGTFVLMPRSTDVATGKGIVHFSRLIEPTKKIVAAFSQWENDPELIPLSRPNANQEDLEKRQVVTVEDLEKRLKHTFIYLIYLDQQLIGEMSYQVDPRHLFKKEPGTAWIGITIGEDGARGKGIGFQAMQFLEDEVKRCGLKRIELGVFEFNAKAIRLYQKSGYSEIGRIPDFTFWQGKLWQDIRMEKRFPGRVE